MTLKKADKI